MSESQPVRTSPTAPAGPSEGSRDGSRSSAKATVDHTGLVVRLGLLVLAGLGIATVFGDALVGLVTGSPSGQIEDRAGDRADGR